VDVGYGARLEPPGVVDQVLGVRTELVIEHIAIHLSDAAQVEHAVARQPPRNARPDVPNVGYGPMAPHLVAKPFLIENADVIGRMLRRHIERDLRQKQIRADSRRSGHARPREHRVHQHDRQILRRFTVKGEVRRGVDEALVDGVHVHVLGGYVAQIHAVNIGRGLHVVAHMRFGHDVIDALGNFEHPAAVAHAELFHRGRHRKADGGIRPLWICNDQVRGHRVKPAASAFDACVEAFQIDAEICSFFVRHGSIVP